MWFKLVDQGRGLVDARAWQLRVIFRRRAGAWMKGFAEAAEDRGRIPREVGATMEGRAVSVFY